VEERPTATEQAGEEAPEPPHRRGGWWRDRYEGSIVQRLLQGLDDVEFGNWIILFGASFLLSVLPLIILLSAFANTRFDDNFDARLGLSAKDTHVLDGLFKSAHAGWGFGVVLALVLSLAGTIAVAREIQKVYQRIYGYPDERSLQNIVRCFVWVAAVAAEVYLDARISPPLRGLPGGRVWLGLGNLVIATAIFWFGLYWFLRGRESWRRLFPAGLATGVFWVGLGAFASVYFSTALVDDSRLYGAIGVVFDLVTWFIAMGAVITLGALVGHLFVTGRATSTKANPEPTE
jgi:membrane protein